MFYSGMWGTVCDNKWDLTDANLVCRRLGFVKASSYKGNAYYGQGTEHIWLTDVECNKFDNYLEDCSYSVSGDSCEHSHDVGLVCTNEGIRAIYLGHNNKIFLQKSVRARFILLYI